MKVDFNVKTAAAAVFSPHKSSGKDDRRLVMREREFERMRDTNPLKAVLAKAYGLTGSNEVVVNGKTYKKGLSLGKGNHCEAFATDVSGIVVKHLHREAIAKLWATIPKYWAGIKQNTEQAPSKGISVAQILNIKTLTSDIVAVQPQYTFLHKIDPKQLFVGSPIVNQVKKIVDACYTSNTVLEFKIENIGIDEKGTVCVVDVDTAMVEDDIFDGGQEINLDRSLGSFTPKKAQFLDPRNKTQK